MLQQPAEVGLEPRLSRHKIQAHSYWIVSTKHLQNFPFPLGAGETVRPSTQQPVEFSPQFGFLWPLIESTH